jgi:hypothetical protein
MFTHRYESLLEAYYADRYTTKEEPEYLKIGCFGYHDFKDVHCGMLQRPIQDLLEDVFKYPLDPLHTDDDDV